MKKALLWVLLAATGLGTGCLKSTTKVTVKADGSAAITMTVSLDMGTFGKIKAAPEDCTCWRVYQIHPTVVPVARRAVAAFDSAFSEQSVKQKWAGYGLTDVKVKSSESDWRTLTVEATIPAGTGQKFADAMKTAPKDEFLTALPWFLHTRKLLPRIPRFYAGAKEGTVRVEIPVSDNGGDLDALANLTEEWREKLGKQLTYLRNFKDFDEGAVSVTVELPGKIESIDSPNASGVGTTKVTFDVKGSDVTPDLISGQAKAKGMITLTLRPDAGAKLPIEKP